MLSQCFVYGALAALLYEDGEPIETLNAMHREAVAAGGETDYAEGVVEMEDVSLLDYTLNQLIEAGLVERKVTV